MKKADPNSPKLTENDKDVLRKIIEYSKIPDSKIAGDIGISPQAVFKIRSKLETLGIIKGYTPIIDFKKIGIQIITIAVICIKPEAWTKHSDDYVSDRISKIPYIISAYRVSEVGASHILLLGFKDTAQKEQYMAKLQVKNASELEVKETYNFSVEKIIMQNSMGLLQEIIAKKNFPEYDLFPRTEAKKEIRN
jgi:Lrp/AsnC family leucine-responsive transcriptional regulator